MYTSAQGDISEMYPGKVVALLTTFIKARIALMWMGVSVCFIQVLRQVRINQCSRDEYESCQKKYSINIKEFWRPCCSKS